MSETGSPAGEPASAIPLQPLLSIPASSSSSTNSNTTILATLTAAGSNANAATATAGNSLTITSATAAPVSDPAALAPVRVRRTGGGDGSDRKHRAAAVAGDPPLSGTDSKRSKPTTAAAVAAAVSTHDVAGMPNATGTVAAGDEKTGGLLPVSDELKAKVTAMVDAAYQEVKNHPKHKSDTAEQDRWKAACASVFLFLCSGGGGDNATTRLALLRELVSLYSQPPIASLDVTVRDDKGSTGLILAAQNEQLEAVKYLIGLGLIDVDAQNKSGMTALICASRSDNVPLVQFLCETGKANVHLTNQWGDSALLFASKQGNGTVVEWLIHHTSADLHATDSNGDSALVSVIKTGHGPFIQMATFLLQLGAPLPRGVVLSLAANPKWTPERLYEVCLHAVKFSPTPILEALNFAHCFSELADKRPSLREEFTTSSKQFTDVASTLFDKLPSDMVAAWTLEQISTSPHHNGHCVLSLALDSHNTDFCCNFRVVRIANAWWWASSWKTYDLIDMTADFPAEAEEEQLTLRTQLHRWISPLQMFRAPKMKFAIEGLCFLSFLFVFAYFLTQQVNVESEVKPLEMCLYIFAAGYLLPQFSRSEGSSGGWLLMDQVVVTCLFVVFLCRMPWTGAVDPDNPIPKSVAVDLIFHIGMIVTPIVMAIRALFIFTTHATIGPLLLTLQRIMVDVRNFLILLLLLVGGFALAFLFAVRQSQSIVFGFHNISELLNTLFALLFGGFSYHWFDDLPGPRRVVINVLAICYLGVTALLLTNLLIALMSNTINDVAENSVKEFLLSRIRTIWRYDRYNRSDLPPPLNLVVRVVYNAYRMLRTCSGAGGGSGHGKSGAIAGSRRTSGELAATAATGSVPAANRAAFKRTASARTGDATAASSSWCCTRANETPVLPLSGVAHKSQSAEWVCRHCYRVIDHQLEKLLYARLENELLHDAEDMRATQVLEIARQLKICTHCYRLKSVAGSDDSARERIAFGVFFVFMYIPVCAVMCGLGLGLSPLILAIYYGNQGRTALFEYCRPTPPATDDISGGATVPGGVPGRYAVPAPPPGAGARPAARKKLDSDDDNDVNGDNEPSTLVTTRQPKPAMPTQPATATATVQRRRVEPAAAPPATIALAAAASAGERKAAGPLGPSQHSRSSLSSRAGPARPDVAAGDGAKQRIKIGAPPTPPRAIVRPPMTTVMNTATLSEPVIQWGIFRPIGIEQQFKIIADTNRVESITNDKLSTIETHLNAVERRMEIMSSQIVNQFNKLAGSMERQNNELRAMIMGLQQQISAQNGGGGGGQSQPTSGGGGMASPAGSAAYDVSDNSD